LGIHGKRDPEAEKLRIEKAQAAGFGQAGKAGRPKKDATQIIEEKAAERMEKLVDMALDGIERAMKSGNEKTALSGAEKFLKTFYHPTQKVDVNHAIEHTEYHLHMLKSQNELSESDQALLGDFLEVLRDASEKETIELEATEVKEITEEQE
jgi:hypothetical protein